MRPGNCAPALIVLAIFLSYSVAMACTESATAEVTVDTVNKAGQACTVAVVATPEAAENHTGPVAAVKATVRAGATIGRAVWSAMSTVVAALVRTAAHSAVGFA
jgi:hypothetical protein